MFDVSTVSAAVGVGANVIATLVAAYSAYLSRRSADAAYEAVNEARRARRDEILPRLILDRQFFDLEIIWPHDSALNDEPVLLARRDWRDEEKIRPAFLLCNYGSSPALDIALVFELFDPNGDVNLSACWGELGISAGEEFPTGSPGRPGLYVARNGGGQGAPLFKRIVVPVANCSPGAPRNIEFPNLLISRIFLRGLQQWDQRANVGQSEALVLTVLISCHTVDGERVETQFRFSIYPFAAAQILPARVHTRFNDLPMYPQPDLEPQT
jgi:hypothetical protein